MYESTDDNFLCYLTISILDLGDDLNLIRLNFIAILYGFNSICIYHFFVLLIQWSTTSQIKNKKQPETIMCTPLHA